MAAMAVVRFCPFCRESFEDADSCPEHGLRLVEFMELPRELDEEPGDAWLPLKFTHQRGWLFLGAALTLVAFGLPMATLSGQVDAQDSMWDMANARTKTLWLVPMIALGQLATLYRRRTPDELRSVRLVAVLFALVPSGVVAFTMRGITEATELMSARMGGVEVTFGPGAWLVFVAALPALWGGARLGMARKRSYRVEVAAD